MKKQLKEIKKDLKELERLIGDDKLIASLPPDEFIIMEDSDLSKEKKFELIKKIRQAKRNWHRKNGEEKEIVSL